MIVFKKKQDFQTQMKGFMDTNFEMAYSSSKMKGMPPLFIEVCFIFWNQKYMFLERKILKLLSSNKIKSCLNEL